ncbi:MAG TPA: phosphoenolpyruvate synthase [Rhabdochlamydiaceae bacterium]|nr:phosphoenolpyruvate synthase [Rhabdochlamydiaceae bacterium]
MDYILWFEEVTNKDVPKVGGKNASLGEMHRFLKKEGVVVPNGFATTSEAYWDFLKTNQLDQKIFYELEKLKKHPRALHTIGKKVRSLILQGKFSEEMKMEVIKAYQKLSAQNHTKNVDVAVRSSATAEDLPNASFAGQQETYLNIRGEKELLTACKKCYASLFTDRAIIYRIEKGFAHDKVALSIGIQKMVRSDIGSAGVIFTLDTETGFRGSIIINAAFGLGENVVQGVIQPDEYMVFKPLLEKQQFTPIIKKDLGKKEKMMIYGKGKQTTKNLTTPASKASQFVLTDKEILQLSKWALSIEKHYQKAMDIEWAKDGKSNQIFIVQARPETVQSQKRAGVFKTYKLKQKGKVLLEGLAIGEAIATGKVQVIDSPKKIKQFKTGSILVTKATSPDWVPIMKQSAGIITDQGGSTSHAAIVSRELGLPAIVGTTRGTQILKKGQEITLSCAEGDIGHIYAGVLPFEETEIDTQSLPKVSTSIMINLASPEEAMRWWHLPVQGVGLARMEFIISNIIKIHPMALIDFDKVEDPKEKKEILTLTAGFKDKKEYFIEHLARGIARIAASQYPYPVIVRMSDFKTNEYAGLIGGKHFEPKEDNPMLGFRGASRYYNPRYRKGFGLECQAIKRAREKMGLINILTMIPFCRTLEEADKVIKVMEEEGLKRKENGLEIYVMCEIPSNVILAAEFAQRFDGFSIGSNDLTQLLLGVDRDSTILAPLFDERNEAVKKMIQEVIQVAQREKCKIGICGQAPSDYPGFAEFLVNAGINSISLNPDSVIGVIQRLAKNVKIKKAA